MDQLDHDIVQDLLPLYHDGVCSDKSRAAVEEHLQTCQDCRKALEEMDTQLPTEKVAVDDAAAVKKISREWERGKWKARMKGAGIAVLVCLLLSVGTNIGGSTFINLIIINNIAYGGYTGPAIRPIIMRKLSEVARNVDIPLSGVGGVGSYRDVVEYIMLGATTVQLCTAVMWNGYGQITKILKDLDAWMDQKGYKSFDEIRGIALKDITTVEKLAEMPPLFAEIDADKCTGCGLCKRSCFYRAIEKQGDICAADKSKCDGCGLCAQLCPAKAITLR